MGNFDDVWAMPASRRNDIAYMVNCQVSKSDAGLKSKAEEKWFDYLMDEAEKHLKKYGFYPVFEMEEIEYDDPRLDIYRNPVKLSLCKIRNAHI